MSKKQKRIILPALTVLILALIALGVAMGRARRVFARTTVAVPRNATVDKSEIQGLVIAILPTGFIPPEMELTKGRYLFIVQNRCGIRDLTFRLDRVNGERLHEVHDQKLQWKNEFDLNPGTYVLSVADHEAWRCVITVTAK